MKRFFLFILLFALLLTSCSFEPTIPENARTFSQYLEKKELYQNVISYFETIEYDAMVSRNDFYSIKGSESFTGTYIQNMLDQSIQECNDESIKAIFQSTDVKLIDWIRREELNICAFDMCIPGKNFDFGVYYTSEDEPVYFGDTGVELTLSGNGFSYEKKASYGAKFTYYTEKIDDHFYYYEIA